MLPRIRAIDKYITAAVLPYTCMALAVLSAILLIQQSARFADILGPSEAPLRLALEVTASLLPSVLVFSIPASVLIGTATGFSQMGQDSELTAMGAAGIGNSRLVLPPLFLGCLSSLLTLYLAFGVAPASARNLRDMALQAALYRLESPVEPRSFYTEIPGKVIFVREGNKQTGEWGKLFIHWQEPSGEVHLVTARAGHLDFSGDRTELVLDDAVITTLPAGGADAIKKGEHVTIERSASMRLRDDRMSFGRDALGRRMREREPELDELGWSGLVQRARSDGAAKGRREAEIALHKRLTLSLSPVVFALFGACLGLKVVRGGRSQGVLLSLAFMLVYYLISLAGEQLGRAGVVPPFMGPWLPLSLSLAGGILLLAGRRRAFGTSLATFKLWPEMLSKEGGPSPERRIFSPLGLIDKTIFWSLVRNFLLTLAALTLVFMVFTVSELLRYIAANSIPPSVVANYLLFLLPLTFIAIAPVSTLLAALITFALLVRRNEMVAWWSSGQSVFRLLLPCLFFAGALGAFVWLVQDRVQPAADRRQNALRGLIRTGAAQVEVSPGRTWVSSPDAKRIYAYDSVAVGGRLGNLEVFDFDPQGTSLESITMSPGASVLGTALQMDDAEVVSLKGRGAASAHLTDYMVQGERMFGIKGGLKKPTEFDFKTLSAYIKELKTRGVGTQPLAVALERKRAEPFFPLVMTLVGVPLALAFGRRGALMALCAAIGAGLLFLGLLNVLQELGSRELLSPGVAVWSSPILFLTAGIYLLSRSRT